MQTLLSDTLSSYVEPATMPAGLLRSEPCNECGGGHGGVCNAIALQGYAPGASTQQWPTDEQIKRIGEDALATIKAPVEVS